MTKLGSAVSLSVIALIMVLGCGYLAFGVARVGLTQSSRTATLQLQDSGGLVDRSKVLLSGIQIGQVTDVHHDAGGVSVSLEIEGRYQLPATGPVRIENLSALGEPYLEFTPNSDKGPFLANGAEVSASRVSLPVSMSDIAQQVTTLLQQVNPDTINNIVSTFSQAFSGTNTVMPELQRSTQLLAATLLSRTDIVRKMLQDLQTRAPDFGWAGPALSRASGPWGDFGPRVHDVVDSFARFIHVGNTPDDYYINRHDELGLMPFLTELEERIAKLGPDMRTLMPVMQPLTTATTNATHQLDISSLIEQALKMTSPNGALQLQLNVK